MSQDEESGSHPRTVGLQPEPLRGPPPATSTHAPISREETTIDILRHVKNALRVTKDEWRADCPLHARLNGKLTILGPPKKTRVWCSVGCTEEAISAELGIPLTKGGKRLRWGPPSDRRLNEKIVGRPKPRLPFSGEIFELCPYRDVVEKRLDGTHNTEGLIECCRAAGPESYLAEAMILGCALGPHQANINFRRIAELGFGIHRGHPLFNIRKHFEDLAFDLKSADPASIYLLWGAPMRSGRPLYSAATQLVRMNGVRGLLHWHRGEFGGLTLAGLIAAWARASGIQHASVLRSLEGLSVQVALSMQRTVHEEPLDLPMLTLAKQLAQSNARKALVIFRCLMRIAAYESGNLVQWHAGWLRGRAAHADAIPGASSFPDIPRILHEHVLRKVRGHFPGVAAARYELRIPILRGIINIPRAANYLNLKLGPNGVPLREPARRR